VWIEPVAKQLDAVAAIGDLYRFDRFTAPRRGVGRSAGPVPRAAER
jgi:hypothetical protein